MERYSEVCDFESGSFAGEDVSLARINVEKQGKIVTDPVRCGRYAGRITLKKTDPETHHGKRAELTFHGKDAYRTDYWYGLSVFLPADWVPDIQSDTLAQWHATRDEGEGERLRSPVLALRTKHDLWEVKVHWDPNRLTNPDAQEDTPSLKIYREPYQAGVWTDWVFHIRWSWEDDGLVEVWRDGALAVSHKGPNCYNDLLGPYFKFGVYKPCWDDSLDLPSKVTVRTVVHDAVRKHVGPEGGFMVTEACP